MKNLTIIKLNGQLLVDSREVGEMVGKRHDNLVRDIKGYKDILEDSSKLSSQDFFIESTYSNAQNKLQPCYLLTKKGCDMVANKMTGEKGVLFTAEYVTRFEEMENTQNLNTSQLSPELQMFNQMFKAIANNELEQKQIKADIQNSKDELDKTKDELQGIREAVLLNPSSWRKDTSSIISKIAMKLGGFEHIRDIREESYKILNETYKVNVKQRLVNKQKNMALEGCSKSKIAKMNFLDVIEEDSKLLNGYLSIVSKMAIKNGIGGNVNV